MKLVTIGLKMDTKFVALLRANVEFSRLRDKDEMEPLEQLGLLVLAEARGGLEEQVDSTILPMWKAHISAASNLRKVEEC